MARHPPRKSAGESTPPTDPQAGNFSYDEALSALINGRPSKGSTAN